MEIPKLFNIEITDYYFTVTVGKRTWYWVKETGEVDGTSWAITIEVTLIIAIRARETVIRINFFHGYPPAVISILRVYFLIEFVSIVKTLLYVYKGLILAL